MQHCTYRDIWWWVGHISLVPFTLWFTLPLLANGRLIRFSTTWTHQLGLNCFGILSWSTIWVSDDVYLKTISPRMYFHRPSPAYLEPVNTLQLLVLLSKSKSEINTWPPQQDVYDSHVSATSGRKQFVILLAGSRTGSNFLAQLFNQNPNFLYINEPFSVRHLLDLREYERIPGMFYVNYPCQYPFPVQVPVPVPVPVPALVQLPVQVPLLITSASFQW